MSVDAHLREELIRSEPAFDGRLLRLTVDTVRCPSGREGRREVIHHPGAIAVVATDEDNRVLLVRQWRHAAGRAIWEIPAGTREPHEDPLVGARRELEEETGYTAASWRALGHGFSAPGFSTEELVFFHATGLTRGTAHPDEDEVLDVELMDLAQIRGLLSDDELDIKTIAGIAMAGISLAHG